MRNAVIYARFSSDLQREESIDAQIRACKEYAARNELHILGVYADEAVSGRTANRAQYQKLLRDAQKHSFDVILIHKYDRIGRNLGEHVNLAARLDQCGVQLVSVSQDFGDSAEAKIMRTLMWSMSEYYIDNLAGEVRKGMKENALRGLHNGGVPPFGYDVIDRRYVVNELEAEFVRRIFAAALHREGFKEIIAEMQAAGIRGKRGALIRYPQIYEMLRNEKYTGVYSYSVEEEKDRADRRSKPHAIRIENALPEIISKAQFQEVQEIMNERKQTGKKAGYLCSGLVYCSCGAKMHGFKSERKGHTYLYYICSAKCGAPSVRMEDVDAAAVGYLRELLNDDNQKRIAEALRTYKGGERDRAESFRKILQKKISEKQKQYDSLLANLASGALPSAVVADIGKEMEALRAEIDALQHTEPPKDYSKEAVRNWLQSLRDAPDQAAVRLLVERIEVTEKTAFRVFSTLNTVLGEIGCGGAQHCLPEILFRYFAEAKSR